MIGAWQYSECALESEYAIVLNMLGLYKLMNKICHHWDIWQGSEYALSSECTCYTGFCRKHSVIDVWQVSEYPLSSQYVRS